MYKENDSSISNSEDYLVTVIISLIALIGSVLWQIIQSPLVQIIKSIAGGIILTYFSWEMIYFDSMVPGIMPTTPLSPSNIKKGSGRTVHLNHAIALANGAIFSLFINWYS